MPELREILETAKRWTDAGPVAVAVSIAADGRLPFPLGSMLVVAADGRFRGTLSGGCLETEILVRAEAVMKSGQAETVSLPVGSALFAGPGGCASNITVLIAPAAPFIAALADLAPGSVLVTDRNAVVVAVRPAGTPGDIVIPVPAPRRLAIVGAVDIGVALASMATIVGYRVEIIEPRSSLKRDMPPGVTRIDDWPEDAFAAAPPDAETAVVVLTHDAKLDDAGLEAALTSPAFYIAALGSRATHARRLDRLRENGFDDAALARIQGPAGLAIGAVAPEEIAASILAAMIAAHRLGAPAERP